MSARSDMSWDWAKSMDSNVMDSGIIREEKERMPSDTIQADNWTEDPEPRVPGPMRVPGPLRIRNAAQEATARVERQKPGLCGRLVGACGCGLCCLPIMVALGVAMVVVGVLHIGHCTVEPRIPYFLMSE